MKGAGYRASQKGQCFSLLIQSVSLDSEPVKSYFIFYYLFTYLFIGKPPSSPGALKSDLAWRIMSTLSAAAWGMELVSLGLMLRMNVKQEPSETKAQGAYHRSPARLQEPVYN